MRAIVLSDNIENGELEGEWGLSVYIEYRGRKILLDTGASDLFAENAAKLGIDLADTDIAVLSHAHYDHANGMPRFFSLNERAKFHINSACRENCFSLHADENEPRYIGMPAGSLREFSDRIVKVSGKTEISEGVTLLPHTTPGLEKTGLREHLFVREGEDFIPDNFSHEQSLVFSTSEGLIIFNSCCHAGASNIIREVREAFPTEKTAALIGGFHLFNRTEEEVRAFAAEVKATGTGYICTGHCTGEAAYPILAEELGGILHRFRCGLEVVFPD